MSRLKSALHSFSQWCKDVKEIIAVAVAVVGLLWAGLSWTIRYQTAHLATKADVDKLGRDVRDLSEKVEKNTGQNRPAHIAFGAE